MKPKNLYVSRVTRFDEKRILEDTIPSFSVHHHLEVRGVFNHIAPTVDNFDPLGLYKQHIYSKLKANPRNPFLIRNKAIVDHALTSASSRILTPVNGMAPGHFFHPGTNARTLKLLVEARSLMGE